MIRISQWLLGLVLVITLPSHALTVHDDLGNSITLDTPAQRIVSLAPSITENLFAIGAGTRVIGTSSSSDYPEAAKTIPIIADYQSINLEAVAALRPDIIIAWQGGNSSAQLAALAQLHIPVYFQKIRTLPEIPLSLMRLAQLTGLEKDAAPTIVNAYSKITLLHDAPQPNLSTFYQVWHSPLMTLNRDSWINDALSRCGATNLFADLPLTAPTVNLETVLQKNPALIITASPNGIVNQDLDMWHKWTNLNAIAGHGLLFTDADAMSRATLRTLDAAQKMCADIATVRTRI
jgi:iron complex transport system substrate-binding protein